MNDQEIDLPSQRSGTFQKFSGLQTNDQDTNTRGGDMEWTSRATRDWTGVEMLLERKIERLSEKI